MGVLALKLFLAPGFVVGTSLVARRHGALVGGLVGGLPVVAGPILIVLTVVHGHRFGADASSACLLGMVSLTAFAVVYARLAPRMPWAAALVVGWCVFAGSTALLAAFTNRPGALAGLVAAFAGFGIGLLLLPAASVNDADAAHPSWDLPMRAVAAAVMVLVITGISSRLGSQLSGLVAPFPVITSVLAAFTHAQRGAGEATVLLRGMLGGFFVYALLVFVYAVVLGAPL